MCRTTCPEGHQMLVTLLNRTAQTLTVHAAGATFDVAAYSVSPALDADTLDETARHLVRAGLVAVLPAPEAPVKTVTK